MTGFSSRAVKSDGKRITALASIRKTGLKAEAVSFAAKGVSVFLSTVLVCSLVPVFSVSAFALENEPVTQEETAAEVQPSETNASESSTPTATEGGSVEGESTEGKLDDDSAKSEATTPTEEDADAGIMATADEGVAAAAADEDDGISAQADELAPGYGIVENDNGFTWKMPCVLYPNYSFEATCTKNADGSSYTLTVGGSSVMFPDNATNTLKKYKITDIVVQAGTGTIARYDRSSYAGVFSARRFPELVRATLNGGIPETGMFQHGTTNPVPTSKLTTVTLNSVPVSDSMFDGCTALSSVTLSGSISEIGNYAFSGCASLTSINLPKGITRIGGGAFAKCSGLTSLVIPEGVKEVAAGSGLTNTFSDCNALTSISFPSTITSIASCGISGLTNLSSVAFSPKTNFDALVLADNSFTRYDGVNNTQLKSIDCITGMPYFYMYRYGTKVFFAEVLPTAEQVKESCGQENVKDGFLIRNGVLELVLDDKWKTAETIDLTGKGITTIGQNAFANFTSLKTIVFPESLKTIGKRAFYGCTSMEGELVFPTSLTSLSEESFGNQSAYRCSKISSVTFKSMLKTIPAKCFNASAELTTVKFEGATAGVDTIGEQAFSECGLTSFDFKASKVKAIGTRAFYSCYSSTLDWDTWEETFSGLTEIDLRGTNIKSFGDYVFSNCLALESILLPEGFIITEQMFSNCKSLKTLSLPKRVVIGKYAFAYCDELTSLTMPENVTIGYAAFASCTALETLALPQGSTIDMGAFNNCSKLKGTQNEKGVWTLVIPERVEFLPPKELPGLLGTFYGCSALTTLDWRSKSTIPAGCFSGCRGLKSLRIAAETIDFQAFNNCTGLTEADLSLVVNCGDDVKWGNDRSDAFRGCTNLTKVTFSDKLKTLGGYAFYGCSKLKEVDLTQAPNLSRIGGMAFYNCKALGEIYIPGNIKIIGSNAFQNCGSLRAVFAEGVEIGELNIFMGTKLSLLILPPSMKSLNLRGAQFNDDSRVVLVDPQRTFNFDNATMDSVGGLREKGKVVIHGTDPGLKDDLTWKDLIVEIEPHDWTSTESADAYGVGKHQVTYKCSGGTYGEYCHGRMLKNSTTNDLNIGWSPTETAQNFFSMNLAEDVNVTAVYTVTSANADAWGVLAAPIRLSLSVSPTNSNTRAAAPATFSLRAARLGAGMVDVYRMAITGGTPSLYQADVPVDANGFVEVLADRVGVYALVGEGAKYVPPVIEKPSTSDELSSGPVGGGFNAWKPMATALTPTESDWSDVPAATTDWYGSKTDTPLAKTSSKGQAASSNEESGEGGVDASTFVLPAVIALVGAAVGTGVVVRRRRAFGRKA